MLASEEHSGSSMPSCQKSSSQGSELPSTPLNLSSAEGPWQLDSDFNDLEINPPLAVTPLNWMPPLGVPCIDEVLHSKRRGRSRTKSVVNAVRECPSMPLGWLEEETCRTSGNQSGKIEKFYIDPTTRKKFRSILRAREHLDETYGPRDWSVYDSGRMRQTRKGKKVVQAAIEPVIMIDDLVDEEAPAAATRSFGPTFLSDFMGKAVLGSSLHCHNRFIILRLDLVLMKEYTFSCS
ncbi:hypothetical protein AKJ16_DCAP13515 [Drosera capensis]